jgi:hypothetical protein
MKASSEHELSNERLYSQLFSRCWSPFYASLRGKLAHLCNQPLEKALVSPLAFCAI